MQSPLVCSLPKYGWGEFDSSSLSKLACVRPVSRFMQEVTLLAPNIHRGPGTDPP